MSHAEPVSLKGLVGLLGGGAVAALILALLVLFLLNIFV